MKITNLDTKFLNKLNKLNIGNNYIKIRIKIYLKNMK